MSTSLPLVVIATRDLTARVRAIEVRHAGGDALPAYTAGSHVEVDVPGIGARHYSLIDDPDTADRYTIAVLREDGGRGGSLWMHQLAVGDRLTTSAPYNDFALDEHADDYLLIAGGIGITPLRAMTYRLERLGKKFELIYCTRSRADTAFLDEMEQRLAGRALLIHDDGDPKAGLDLASTLATPLAGRQVYVCGPVGMIAAARAAARHWPADTVRYELFSSGAEVAGAPPVAAGDSAFEVDLARTGRTIQVGAQQTILDALKGEGIEVRTVCREGWCGTCKVGLIAGAVDHRDDALEDDEREHFLQVCVSRAMPGERLVLDL